jgi:hypothetical protein
MIYFSQYGLNEKEESAEKPRYYFGSVSLQREKDPN